MSIQFQVLGGPRDDNALFVWINTGQEIHRLLFDCGEGCLSKLGRSEIQETKHLFFSHLHMDHVAGFDHFLRINLGNRIQVWGPPETARIIQHRLRGIMWNLHRGLPGEWQVTDLSEKDLIEKESNSWRFRTREAFEIARPTGNYQFIGPFFTRKRFYC